MNKLLEHCIKEIEYVYEEIFTVKDLLKGYEWNRLSTGEKRNIRYLFRNYIYANKDLNIVNVVENSNQKQSKLKYKKVKKNAE